MFKNIGIVLKKSLSSKESSVLSGLLSVLLKNTKAIYSSDQIDFEGVEIVDLEKFNHLVDLIIVFGGDGTLLGAARKFIENEIPILGINMGAVGFLTDVNIENFESVISNVFKGDYILEERSLVEAQFSDQEVFGLNEVLIHSGSYAQLMRYRLLIELSFLYLFGRLHTPLHDLKALQSIESPEISDLKLLKVWRKGFGTSWV